MNLDDLAARCHAAALPNLDHLNGATTLPRTHVITTLGAYDDGAIFLPADIGYLAAPGGTFSYSNGFTYYRYEPDL